MTHHTWISGATGFVYDTTDYVDAMPFAAGDTLLITAGLPEAASAQSGVVASLQVGTYEFAPTASGTGFETENVTLPAGALILIDGTRQTSFSALDQFINYGTIQVGTAAHPAALAFSSIDGDARDGSFTNSGTLSIETGSTFTYSSISFDGNLTNTATGQIVIAPGGTFNALAAAVPGATNLFTNDGLISVEGAAGEITTFAPVANYGGNGLLLVTGASGEAPADTVASLGPVATGTVDLASGELELSDLGAVPDPTVSFLDNNAAILATVTETTNSMGNYVEQTGLQATLNNFVAGDSIGFTVLGQGSLPPPSTESYDAASHLLTIVLNGVDTVQLTFNGSYQQSDFIFGGDGVNYTLTTNSTANALACYCAGTMIRTIDKDMPVEQLHVGDLVTTLSGVARPVRWIGRRSYAKRFVAGHPAIYPVCIAAGALADKMPSRDLFVSPSHALYFDGVLIEARHLINGTTVVQKAPAAQLHYYHVELDTHDVIWAEGTPAESYVEDGDRSMFQNAEQPSCPGQPSSPAVYCAPRIEQGIQVETVRRRILGRSIALRVA